MSSHKRVFFVHATETQFDETELRINNTRIYRDRVNYFTELDDAKFVQRFRLTKSTCKIILARIEDQLACHSNRNHAMLPETQLLVALRFYASGSFLITAGDFCGVSVPSASRAVKKVSNAIALLARDEIVLNAENLQGTVNGFFEIAKFPKVIGAIDCTHVKIQSPGGEQAEIFRNRKGYFSFNVLAVCNAKLMLTNIVARWPGSTHDTTIFNNSRLKYRLDSGEFKNHYILGDSGYKSSQYMMTPLSNPTTEGEKLYNESQIRTRNAVERCFGVWKRRFPLLSMGMRINRFTAMEVIVACGVLHNIAIKENDPMPSSFEVTQPCDESDGEGDAAVSLNEIAGRERDILIATYFATL